MSSVRKRKTMLKKLNSYFSKKGELVGEREYSKDYTAPYRLETIKKHLGGWHRMVYYLGFYYPQWKATSGAPTPTFPEARKEPKVEVVKKDPVAILKEAMSKVDEEDE